VKTLLFMAVVAAAAGVFGSWWSHSSALDMGRQQLEAMQMQMNAQQELAVGTGPPITLALLAVVVSVAVPITLAVLLLRSAERTALHNDEIIRQVARHGLTREMIETERLLNARIADPPRLPRPRFRIPRHKPLRLARPEEDEEPEDS